MGLLWPEWDTQPEPQGPGYTAPAEARSLGVKQQQEILSQLLVFTKKEGGKAEHKQMINDYKRKSMDAVVQQVQPPLTTGIPAGSTDSSPSRSAPTPLPASAQRPGQTEAGADSQALRLPPPRGRKFLISSLTGHSGTSRWKTLICSFLCVCLPLCHSASQINIYKIYKKKNLIEN